MQNYYVKWGITGKEFLFELSGGDLKNKKRVYF
jgi:hypothetical protein